MIAICSGCGRSRFILNKTRNLCLECNRIRLEKQGKFKLTRNQKFVIKYPNHGFNSETEVFQHVWDTRPHMSFISGRGIPEFDYKCFAHILSKKQFPAFRFNPENIVLLTVYEHGLYDQGTAGRRLGYPADWKALNDLAIKLKIEYNNKFNPRAGYLKVR